MEWNGNLRNLVSRPEASFNFLYNYNYESSSGMELKHPSMASDMIPHGLNLIPTSMEKMSNNYGHNDKKKRLTSEQLESLERSFQEEIKLDPDRKTKLSKELGLQPRQIAVWFQNRRARWKTKQLERLYDALKQEFDAVSREKHKLQEEVMKLKAIVRNEQVMKQKQMSNEMSGEETVEESTSAAAAAAAFCNSNKGLIPNYLFNIDEFNPAIASPFWTALPSYP